MAIAITFDTHKFVRKLKSAGFNDPQAEALTDAVQESLVSLDVATKQDLADIRREIHDLRKDMGAFRKDMEVKIEILRKDIILKLGSLMVVVVAIVPSITRLLYLPA